MKTPIYLKLLYVIAVVIVGIGGYIIHDYHVNVLAKVPTPPPPVAEKPEDIVAKLKQMARDSGMDPDRKPTEGERWKQFTDEYDRTHGRPALVYCTDPRKGTYCPN